jgi:adenosylmethionine-8-amino-7-oxononanoate aminotransferase
VTGSAQTAAQAGSIITDALTEAGVLVRPYGNTIAFGPAISTSEADVDAIFERFDATLARLQR